MKNQIIAIDFDGTITVVEHDFPSIGKEVPYAIDTMLELQALGHKLILWTIRSASYLKQAKDFLEDKGIKLWGTNENPTQKYWSGSPKVHADIFIDDMAFGCPLIQPAVGRPYVDWLQVRKHFKLR